MLSLVPRALPLIPMVMAMLLHRFFDSYSQGITMHGPVDPLYLLAWLLACVGLLLLVYSWHVRASRKRRAKFFRDYLARHKHMARSDVFCQHTTGSM